MNQTLVQNKFIVEDLSLIDYEVAYQRQINRVQQVIDTGKETIIMCEHLPVLTLGRLAKESNILWPQKKIAEQRVDIQYIDRGGDITLHAPGQLVVYPIIDLKKYGRDLHAYMNNLETVIIMVLSEYGIMASRKEGQTGVWVDQQKIASIGIGVKKWVTFHGCAININTDLSLFSMIRPCDLDVKMTSLAHIKGQQMNMESVKEKFLNCFNTVFS